MPLMPQLSRRSRTSLGRLAAPRSLTLLLLAWLQPAVALCVGSGCDILRVGLLGFLFGAIACCCLFGHGVGMFQVRASKHRNQALSSTLVYTMLALAAIGLLLYMFMVGYTAGVLGENDRWDLWPLLLFAILFLLAFAALLGYWIWTQLQTHANSDKGEAAPEAAAYHILRLVLSQSGSLRSCTLVVILLV